MEVVIVQCTGRPVVKYGKWGAVYTGSE